MIRTIILCLFLLATIPAVAQTPPRDADIKYRLAQSYERSGDWEAAAKLYEELYQREPTNAALVDALRRGYVQLKRFDDAIRIVEGALQRTPNDIYLMTQLGQVYLQKSDEKKASEIWDRAVAINPSQEQTYRIVGNAAVQSRSFDYAIALYKRARTALGDPLLFANDVAYLQSIMLNYKGATEEYLSVLKQSAAQLGYVQSRIGSFTSKKEGFDASLASIEQAAKTDAQNATIQRLLAWIYMEGKQYDKAFQVYRNLDQSTNANGREIYSFAERALKEKSFDVATQAFAEIIRTRPQFEFLPQARFGYARCLEAQDAERDTNSAFIPLSAQHSDRPESEAAPLYQGAIAAYNAIVKDFNGSEIAARALLRVAALKHDRFADLDGARTTLELLVKDYRQYTQHIQEATLRLGDVYLGQGDLQRAEQQYTSLAGQKPYIGELRERAAFKLAELDYYRGNFQAGLTKLQDLIQNVSSDVANDAIGLQIFIQDNVKTHEALLKNFAHADLLKEQRKLSEAMTAFQEVLAGGQGAQLVDEVLLNMAEISARMQRNDEAVKTYERLLAEFPESIILDRALLNVGEIYEHGLHETAKAIAAYQQVLEKFPNSIYASEARKRIRVLRGDNI